MRSRGLGRTPAGAYGYGGAPYRGGAPAAAPAQPAPNPSNPREQELLRELERENGYYRGLREAQQAAPPPAPTAPAAYDPRVPPPGLTPQEWDEIQTRRQAAIIGPAVATAVTQALAALGFTPQGIAGVAGVAGVQHPLAQPAAAPPADSLAGLKSMLSGYKDFQKFAKEFITSATPEGGGIETPEAELDEAAMKPIMGGLIKQPGTDDPMLYSQKLEEESWAQYIIRLGAHNPALAQRFINKAIEVLDPRALAAFLEKMATASANKGKPAQQGQAPQIAQGGQPP